MNKILVWDIPARLVHWAFAAALTVAAVIGFLVDKEQPLFQLHMLFGIIAVLMLIVRILEDKQADLKTPLPRAMRSGEQSL